jgi:hypothetical protein
MTRHINVLAVLLVFSACGVTFALQHDSELDLPQTETGLNVFQSAWQGCINICKWVRPPYVPFHCARPLVALSVPQPCHFSCRCTICSSRWRCLRAFILYSPTTMKAQITEKADTVHPQLLIMSDLVQRHHLPFFTHLNPALFKLIGLPRPLSRNHVSMHLLQRSKISFIILFGQLLQLCACRRSLKDPPFNPSQHPNYSISAMYSTNQLARRSPRV